MSRVAATVIGLLKESMAVLKGGGVAGLPQAIWQITIVNLRRARSRIAGRRSYGLFAMDSSADLSAAAANARGHTFEFADAVTLRNHAPVLPDYVVRRVEALERGDRCLLQLNGSELVGLTWVSGSQIVPLMEGVLYQVPDEAFYSYQGYTAPKWRGLGFQPLRKLKLLQEYEPMGKRWLFGYVSDLSLAALRGTRRSGDSKVGMVRVTHRGGRIRVRLAIDESFWATAIRD